MSKVALFQLRAVMSDSASRTTSLPASEAEMSKAKLLPADKPRLARLTESATDELFSLATPLVEVHAEPADKSTPMTAFTFAAG
jgi:uncharacterized caspase-like protein